MQGGAGWIGGSEYIRNLIEALRSFGPDQVEVSLISGRAMEDGSQTTAAKLKHSIQLPPVHRGLLSRFISSSNNGRLSRAIREHGIDFVYPLTYDNSYNLGVDLPLAGAMAGAAWAGWIPDFQHKHLPHLFDAREIAKRDRGIALLAGEARTMVFSSHAALEDFHAFCSQSRARAEVLHFCTSAEDSWFEADPGAVRRKYHLSERYFLVSNQLWLHKNHLLVVEALGILAERGIRPQVVWTGQPSDFRDKGYLNTVLAAIHQGGVAAQISLLGLIPKLDQIQLMRGALAVVQPSLCEGWSTVLEDARALGKDVLASDLAVHKEQNPPGAEFFERQSAESLAEILAKAWHAKEPGPDLDRESQARAAAKQAMAGFARRFGEIARSAIGH